MTNELTAIGITAMSDSTVEVSCSFCGARSTLIMPLIMDEDSDVVAFAEVLHQMMQSGELRDFINNHEPCLHPVKQ